jgi:ABC-type multidrug transport system ATPase subunit
VCARLKPEDVVNDDHVLSRLDDDEPLADWFNVKLPIALFLFTYQICNFSYFCSFWFPSAKMAIAFMPFFCLVLIMGAGAFTGMAIFGLGRNGFELIQPDQSDIVGSMLWLIAVVSPHGALCMALLHIGDICRDVSPDVCVVPPYSWSCLLMAAEGSLYLYMTYRIDLKNFLAIEAKPNPANTPERLARMRNKIDENVRKENEAVLEMEEFEIERQAQPFIGANGDTIYRDAVNPVLGATVRTAVYLDEGSGLLDPYSLRVAGLRKLYPPKKPGEKALAAVENLSLRIPRGEVFGLLGANGAGKTTAISMIMRSTYPNFGDIHIEGYSVLKDFKMAAKHLGVVTQHNTLWDRLSCKDHLKLFAQIRGVPPHEVDEMVQRTIIELELGPYQNKLAMQLSGGLKRKLCVAVALIGDPKLVLLDEPSAGLDPVSRRNLWDTLIRTMASRAVVLTTHSMEEAEALCTRIGIMVKGQLRALGTPQELKIQLGVGYEIALKVHQLHDTPSTIQAGEADEGGGQKPANDHESLANILKSKFPSICEISNNGGLVTYSIPAAEMNVGVAFSMLEQMRSDLGGFDYAIAQPTLEQVFVSTVIAHSGEERKAKTIDNSTSASTRYNPSSMSNKSSVTTLVASHTSKQQQSHPTHTNTNDSNHLSIDQASNNDNGVSYHNKNNHQTTIAEVGGLGERDSIFDDEDLDTGIPGTWCGLNKRSHRFMAIAAGFLAWLGYQTIFRARVGYVFLPFLISFVASVIGCAGCCCLIPSDPDEETDKE